MGLLKNVDLTKVAIQEPFNEVEIFTTVMTNKSHVIFTASGVILPRIEKARTGTDLY